ncbi:NAD-dependent epimerase/dehydratase family protein [Crateriforma spongiae]|uniref:NAD-dependent epimerase/dehydratase family protein n=1 Tax=Crateriforma spongiae TaxID=2724528 RepID=UPI001447B80B|nr:NAD-dependent epimerase/dehydratase family protein [Crateriforma spongiae]
MDQAESCGVVLVAGCAGFIGSRVVCRLLDRGVPVVGVDNLNDYYDVSLKFHRLQSLREREGFHFHSVDISDRIELASVFQRWKFGCILNLAARAGVRYSMENPYVYMATNAQGSLNLLEEARAHGVEKYVLASTSSLYAGQPMPFVESLAVNTPISPYAATKKAAEAMAFSYHHLYGVDVSIVRYFTVYGPAGRPDMSYFRFIHSISNGLPITVYGDGEQSRDFTYVDDIAAGTVLASKRLGYEIINLGGGNQPYSINDVIRRLEDIIGKKAIVNYTPAHVADMNSTWANIDKAKALLGWQPGIGLGEGLERCVDWYRNNENWLSTLPGICDTA